MVKKALCVGINDYPYDGSKLKGCVNDARTWTDLLICPYNIAEEALVDDELRILFANLPIGGFST